VNEKYKTKALHDQKDALMNTAEYSKGGLLFQQQSYNQIWFKSK